MTDNEFWETIAALRDHADSKRREAMKTVDVNLYDEWNDGFSALDSMLIRRSTDRRLKALAERQK